MAALHVLLSALPAASGQMPIHVLDAFGSGTGRDIANVGDIDGDGFDDLLVGDNKTDVTGTNSGSVRLYSSRTGSVLGEWHGDEPGVLFGTELSAAGDVNGDGVPDLLIGSSFTGLGQENHGRVWALSGSDGAVLFKLSGTQPEEFLGEAVTHLRDADGDGRPEFVIGAASVYAGPEAAGRVLVVSSSTGGLLYELHGEEPGSRFGSSLVTIEDLDGDGIQEFAAAAPGGPGSIPPIGIAQVHSGADGTLLFVLHAPGPSDKVERVCHSGDWDGDGIADIIGITSGHRAIVWSGADGSMLFAKGTQDYSGGGWDFEWAVSVDDATGDGARDLVVGATFSIFKGHGRLYLLAGPDGRLAMVTYGFVTTGHIFGRRIASLDDIDGDGLCDVAVASYGTDVQVLSLASSPWTAVGDPLGTDPLSFPVSLAYGSLQPDSDVVLKVSHAQPAASVFLVVGQASLKVPFKGGVLYPSPDVVIPLAATDALGKASTTGRWPSGTPSGTSLWVQWWIADPAGPQGFTATHAAWGMSP